MGLLSRFFPRKKESVDREKLARALECAEQMVFDFGEFVQTPEYPKPGSVADTNRLPYEKERLKAAFQLCITACRDEARKQLLKTVYSFLADFQDGVGKKDLGACIPEEPEARDPRKVSEEEYLLIKTSANNFLEDRQAASPFLAKVDAEREVLLAEVANL